MSLLKILVNIFLVITKYLGVRVETIRNNVDHLAYVTYDMEESLLKHAPATSILFLIYQEHIVHKRLPRNIFCDIKNCSNIFKPGRACTRKCIIQSMPEFKQKYVLFQTNGTYVHFLFTGR
jgi:hypothetical protein